MSYFPDLSEYSYVRTEKGPWRQLVNVGWLEPPHHPFPTGTVPEEFTRRLARLCVLACAVQTRGWYACEQPSCRDVGPLLVVVDGEEAILGSAEIRVGFPGGTWYAAPNLVHHYVTGHGYRPPDEFVAAVLHGETATERSGGWVTRSVTDVDVPPQVA